MVGSEKARFLVFSHASKSVATVADQAFLCKGFVLYEEGSF